MKSFEKTLEQATAIVYEFCGCEHYDIEKLAKWRDKLVGYNHLLIYEMTKYRKMWYDLYQYHTSQNLSGVKAKAECEKEYPEYGMLKYMTRSYQNTIEAITDNIVTIRKGILNARTDGQT